MTTLTQDIAARFAALALGHVRREYPHKLDHVMDGPEDVLGPRALHPIFFGSFDWHSCVHGYWLLLSLARRFPQAPFAAEVRALADTMLVPHKVAGELAYLDRAYTGGFERPYGWAWLLALHGEAARHKDAEWGEALEPLAREFAQRFRDFLPLADLSGPGRHAFQHRLRPQDGGSIMRRRHRMPALSALLRETGLRWYGEDADCPAWGEPSGDDFQSSALIEAECMRRPAGAGGVPALARALPAAHRETGAPDLVRACRRQRPQRRQDRPSRRPQSQPGLVLALAGGQLARRRPAPPGGIGGGADAISPRLPHIAGDYMGEHWLATFALLALTAGEGE
jgi:hypothetical protein